MKKANEYRDMSLEELEANCQDSRKQLFKLVNDRATTKQFEKPHRIPALKKQIAVMLTILGEKKAKANS